MREPHSQLLHWIRLPGYVGWSVQLRHGINSATTSNTLPPLAEQHRIVSRVDALMALCDQLEVALTTTATTRARLLETLIREALNADQVPEMA